LLFVDSSSSTEKSLLFKALLNCVRAQNKTVFSVASSGIAAILLPGRRTAHSRFNIPLNINHNSSCSVVDSAYKHISFAGKMFAFDCDFQQILPVIKWATLSDVVGVCLNCATLWRSVKVLHLTQN
ncbi:hypothetical protein PHYBLDRAFT_87100, partial [Phycomyces blakesleeanus NRRL 1555(-)]